MDTVAKDFTTEDDDNFYVTPVVKNFFDRHGYILVRNLLSTAETDRLKDYMERNPELQAKSYGRLDGQGLESRLALWNVAGDDVSGMVSRYISVVSKQLQNSQNLLPTL